MRVLILSAAVLACATAAPSGALISPYIQAVALPAAIPTISSGDIQAAAINTKVFYEDQAIAAADRARQLSEQAFVDINDKVIEANALSKEKTEEAFWASEDQKWQALDAVQTVEAKIDGAAANNADILAKSTLGGVVVPSPVIAPIATPLIAPIAPVSPVYYASSGFVAPAIKSISTEPLAKAQAELAKSQAELAKSQAELVKSQAELAKSEDEKEKSEATVKTADVSEKATESAEAKPTDPVQIGTGNVKAIETVKSGDKFLAQTLTQSHPIIGNLALAPSLNLAQPWLAAPQAYFQPGVSAYATSSVQHLQGQYLTPTLIKTQW